MREAPRLKAEFNHCTMEPGEGGSDHVVWRFSTKDLSFADVFLSIKLDRPFESLRLRVKNDGPAFSLSAKLREQSNAEWTPSPQLLAADGPWSTIEFKASDFDVASWSSDSDRELSLLRSYSPSSLLTWRPIPTTRSESRASKSSIPIHRGSKSPICACRAARRRASRSTLASPPRCEPVRFPTARTRFVSSRTGAHDLRFL